MGVHDLWSILGPVRESVPLYSLTGKTLAVDLSLWVCEAQHVQAMMGRVTKPHLRNLFFRVSSLTLMGVKLVFVMEGEAPKLKAETMSKRTEMRFGRFKKAAPKSTTSKNTGRGRFNAILRECAEMLDSLGVPWVTAAGEAEAMCAYLDSQGLVDGCITNDGDVFLYGAQTVYRNFNLNTKDPQVDCYRTSRVRTELHLSRENLVGLAILLGCDYIPKGIPGVGREHALRLIQTLKGQTLLQRFSQWREEGAGMPERAVKKVPHCHLCRHPGSAKGHERGGCVLCDSKQFCEPQDFDYQCPCDWHRSEQTRHASSVEANIRRKTLVSEQFPFTEIINEFLMAKDKPVQHFRRRKPNMLSMQNFAYNKMDWPKHYTSEKVLVLMTYAELMNRKYGRDTSPQIKPLRILKPRVRNAVACFEIIWSAPEHYVFPEEQPAERQDEVRTVEEEALFRLAYPEVVELYLRDKALAVENKTKKKKTKSHKEKPRDLCDGVSELLAQMTLQSSTVATGDTQTQAPPPTVTNTDKPEVVVLDTPVAPKQHLYQREDRPGLEDCPGAQVKEMVSPLCLPSRGWVTGSENSASPSVSSVIDALQLSDIDWEALSFTSSPPPQAATTRTAEPKPAKTADSCIKEGDADTKQEISAVLRPAPEPCYTDCSLRERVLMSNMLKSMNQMEARIDEVTKHLLYTSIPLEPTGMSSCSQDSKQSGLIPIKGSIDTSLSGKPQVVDQKAPLVDKDQSVTTKADQAYHTSKLNVVPSAKTQGKAKDNVNGNQKPLQKYKFVKAATSSSSVSSQRSHSDPGQGDKDRKLHQTTKKSVCASVYSSSEDSDAENQRLGTRRTKIKPKSKPKTSYLTDLSLKPISRVATTKITPNSGYSSHSLKPKVLSNSVGDQTNASSVSTKVKCCSASTKGKCQDVPPVPVEDDVLIVTPASPVTVSDSDDSVVCGDSPLPLAERLKLRFLM